MSSALALQGVVCAVDESTTGVEQEMICSHASRSKGYPARAQVFHA